ncbi:alkaline phosphatase family protein [Halorientalis halophila]|uniref:alkaline phosphatase family protein n=1 Tax=Halorientalis halophila TaxID=3108499 RepID=UPI00300BF770
MTETIVLGLDGATWDVLDPLIEGGELPNIAAVRDEGYSGALESVYPPTSGPAWASMATGMNPGKTGVFYFLNRTDPDSFEFESMSSRDFEGRSFWDVLGREGKSTGVFNFPMLHPPYEMEGYMVSGFGAPKEEFTYPSDLAAELEVVAGEYEIKIPFSDPKYAGRPGELATTLLEHLDGREAVIDHLLTERRTDVFCGVVSVTDWMQHYYWKYADDRHVLHDPEGIDGESHYRELWRRVDDLVGTVHRIARERNATLLLISDHGFGPFDGTFYVNDWLEAEGFRVPAKQSKLGRARDLLFPHVRRIAEPVVERVPVLNDLATSVGRSMKPTPTETVDIDRSIACATDKGFIHMLSDDPADRERVVDALGGLFEDHDLEYEIFAPEDLYAGPAIDLAPDILYTIEDFEYALQANRSPTDEVLIERPPSPSRSGGHKRDGIFVVAGEGAASGSGARASLLDIAPTILYSQNVPIPTGMDGDVIKDAFEPAYRDDREIEFREYGIVEPSGGRGGDADAVREHLEDLGYV